MDTPPSTIHNQTSTMSEGEASAPPPPESPIPAPASVTLPLTFHNSFWSQDYRTGFQALYKALEQGLIESDELVAQIKRRAIAEKTFSEAVHPHALRKDGFAADEGASLRMGLEALLTSTVQEAKLHAQLHDELIRSIASPFEDWSEAHRGRIRSSRAAVESHLIAYEKKLAEVQKLKQAYDDACRIADQAEDELSFSRGSQQQPTSPPSSQSPIKLPFGISSPMRRSHSSQSDDGVDPEGDDETLVGRSGATGGSIAAALGRAFTTRRAGGRSGGGTVKRSARAQEKAPEGTTITPEEKELPASPVDVNVDKAVEWSRNTFNTLFEKVAGPQTGEGKEEKTRKEAEAIEERYKLAVDNLDTLRLTLEETLSEHLQYTHRCEQDRLRAAASVLRSFHGTLTSLPSRVLSGSEKVKTSLGLIRPERDVVAIVERSRTGPFTPKPFVFSSHYSEGESSCFGIDLRKFDETRKEENKVPPVLEFLLGWVAETYSRVDDTEKRKAWLYETPLAAQHHLRSQLNHHDASTPFDPTILKKYDLPVVVSTIKLWLLELEVPVVLYTHYDEYRELYPKRVGKEKDQVPAKLIGSHVARLPPVHLEVLRAIITHFSDLIAHTKTEETDEVYLQKLALSIARCLVRPKFETSLTLDDRFPALLFTDLVKNCEEVFKAADELRTKQREDRYKPRRQRTKPVDVRISRSRIGVDAHGSVDLGRATEVLAAQRSGVVSPPPPVPPLPSGINTAGLAAPVSISKEEEGGFAASPVATTPTQESFSAGQTQQGVSAPVVDTTPSAPPAEEEEEGVTQEEQKETTQNEDEPLAAPVGGSLKRREGATSARRGVRGPRPLPAGGEGAEGEGKQGHERNESFARSKRGLVTTETEGED